MIRTAADYMLMFTSLQKLPFAEPYTYANVVEQVARQEIDWAKRVLKKSDRIIWWLRWVRLGILRGYAERGGNFQSLTDDWQIFKKELDAYNRKAGSSYTVSNVWAKPSAPHPTLEHLFGVPSPKMQAYQPGYTSVREVIREMEDLDEEWQLVAKTQVQIHPGDEVLIQFPDGSAWWKLARGYCPEEAKAMGHCGNAGAAPDDTILSYRTPVRQGDAEAWQPHLTFILNGDGYLGEMKGRGNTRPTAKYFPYIVKLLENPIVKGLRGGGYKPEANFHTEDLDEKTQDRLYTEKPALTPLIVMYKRDRTVTPDLIAKIAEYFEQSGDHAPEWDAKLQGFKLEDYRDLKDLLKHEGDKDSEYAYEIITGNRDDDDSVIAPWDDFFTGLSSANSFKVGQILLLQDPEKVKEWEEEEGTSFSSRDPASVDRYATWLQDDHLIQACENAQRTGYRVAWEESTSHSLEQSLSESPYRQVDSKASWIEGAYVWLLTVEEAMELVADEQTLEDFKEDRPENHLITADTRSDRYDGGAAVEEFEADYFADGATLRRLMAKPENAATVKDMEEEDRTIADFQEMVPRLKESFREHPISKEEQQQWNEAQRHFNRGYTYDLIQLVRTIIPDAFSYVEGVEPLGNEADREAAMADGGKTAADYMGMFNSLLALPDEQFDTTPKESVRAEINDQISWAKRVLKKNDRIVWWLRWFKLRLLYDDVVDQGILVKEMAAYNAKGGTSYTEENVRASRMGGGSHSLYEHYFGTAAPKIQAYQPGYKSLNDVGVELRELEREWQKEQDSYLKPQDGDQELIKFPDGSAWWKLGRGYCAEEGKAMGHCGNGGSGRSDEETILSYRTPAKNGTWQPHLTFILDTATGVLGEMKGRNNTRPVAKYFPVIVKLLENPIVKGLVGGGYKPEANFHLEDLDAKTLENLYEQKPSLMPLSEQFKKHGETQELLDTITARLMESDGSRRARWEPELKHFVLREWRTAEDLVKDQGDEETRTLADYLTGERDYEPGYGDWEEMLGQLPEETLGKVGRLLVLKYPEEIADWEEVEDEEFDPTDADKIKDFLKATEVDDDDLTNNLEWANEDGRRVGAESEMHEALISALSASAFFFPKVEGVVSLFEGEWFQGFTVQGAIDFLDEGRSLEEFEDEGPKLEVRVPYYGWSEYDEDAAIEDFKERYELDHKLAEAEGDPANADAIAEEEDEDAAEAEMANGGKTSRFLQPR